VSFLLLASTRLSLPGFAAAALLLRGCPGDSPPVTQSRPAGGVLVREIQLHENTTRVRVIDVDLKAPGVRVEVAAEDIARREGRITGAAHSVSDWVERTGAVAGVNGGFFGERVGDAHLEIVGLLKMDGRVRSAPPPLRAKGAGVRYSRAALGFTSGNDPVIGWVTARPGDAQTLLAHSEPVLEGPGAEWKVREAVGCGPRLIRNGKAEVSYRGERLASPGRLPRTFVGYGGGRFVMCAATGLEFQECAELLMGYFRKAHDVPCAEAMCLDGGASTQAAWREGRGTRTDSPLNIPVPTALLVFQGSGRSPG
jgi:hypothetical protein